jgi:restriction endonuclease Mrr
MSHFPSSTLPPPCSSPKFPLPWEPALTQLRELSPPELDQLVATWLSALGLSAPRVRERRPGITTYQATLGKPPFSTPVQIRIYQRQNRLQAHHVDSFVGYLTRVGVPSGLLISTGGCSRAARLLAGGSHSRRIVLLAGDDWVAALARARAGVKPRRLWRWIVAVQSALGRSLG